ncbi:MAG: hypothetical protein HGA22_04635 [Clostridiales bacterium]|nr:hypothetical protein [Clostridiales bacterium]
MLKEDRIRRSYRIFSLDGNVFLGAADIFTNTTIGMSCVAAEDSSLYCYPAKTSNQIWSLVDSQKDYGTYILNSLCILIQSSVGTLQKLKMFNNALRAVTENLGLFFWEIKTRYNLEVSPSIKFLQSLEARYNETRGEMKSIIPVFDALSMEMRPDFTSEDDTVTDPAQLKEALRADYYSHISGMPQEIKKQYFSNDVFITAYNCRDAADCLKIHTEKLRKEFDDTEEYFSRLYSEDTGSLFSVFSKAVTEASARHRDTTPVVQALEYIIVRIGSAVTYFNDEYLHKLKADTDYIEYTLVNLKSAISRDPEKAIIQASDAIKSGLAAEAGNSKSTLPDELKSSMYKILEYADINASKAEIFLNGMASFKNLPDRNSNDDYARTIRSSVSSIFFDIYDSVVRKMFRQKDDSRLLNMFVNYGYMDEELLTTDQILTLYRLAGKEKGTGKYKVYSMKDWLFEIYSMNQEPSINEFGRDYHDVFRDLKKAGKVTDEDKRQYDADTEGKVSFEIGNMIKINHRICYGQTSIYFPVLHKDMITRDLSDWQTTSEKIDKSFDKIIKTDFSAFYREVNYNNPEIGIEKELIMKNVLPEIILMPIFGSRPVMWQEISGRSRSTPARFLIPAFTDEDLDDMATRLVAYFRWELCRTMMGSAWNDVTQSSLTADYTDYIQFFKKNKDLSEEARDKIRAQIAKYNNRTREIFHSDYEIWINNESKGNIRLNKVARGILYKHCPFSREIREQLERQPMYSEIAVPLRLQRQKAAKEHTNRYSRYIKRNGALEPELETTLTFYRDL